MKFKNIAIIFAVLVVSALLVYRYEYLADLEKERKESEQKKIVYLEPGKVAKVVLDNGEMIVSLNKVNGQWEITGPIKTKADSVTLEQIITGISSMQVDSIIGDGTENLADYGLSSPAINGYFYVEGFKRSQNVSVGNDTPVGGKVYGQSSKIKNVFVASADFKNLLSKKLYDLREKRIFPEKGADIVSIKIVRNGKQTVFEKDKDNLWIMKKPYTARATQKEMIDLQAKIFGAYASNFIDGKVNENEIGLNPPSLAFTFTNSAGKEFNLHVGKKDEEKNGVPARREGAGEIAMLPLDFFDDIPRNPSDFRDMHFFPVNYMDVSKVSWGAGGREGRMERNKDGDWEIIGNTREKVDQAKVISFLRSLGESKVERFYNDLPLSETKLVSSLEIMEKETKRSYGLYDYGDRVYGLSSFQENTFRISRRDFDKLVKRPDDFIDRKIFKVLQAEISKLSIHYEGENYLLEKSGSKWKMNSPQKGEVSIRRVGQLISSVLSSEYVKMEEGKANTGSSGSPSVPLAVISMTDASGKSAHEITVMGFTRDKTMLKARVKGRDILYYLPESFLKNISMDKLEGLII
ncbi:MAG: DUF4340 domain-containing protein [Nitrospinota bacterium]|nr:DUF4340 domain-containing protein [Nitrospinota bacterium]